MRAQYRKTEKEMQISPMEVTGHKKDGGITEGHFELKQRGECFIYMK
jgi:hypothetical protein